MPPTPAQSDTASRLLDELVGNESFRYRYFEQIEALPATAAILGADARTRIAVIRTCIDRIARMTGTVGPLKGQEHRYMNLQHEDGFPGEARLLVPRLLRRKLPWTSDDLAYLVGRTADVGMVSTFTLPFLPQLVSAVERGLEVCPMTEELRAGLVRLRDAIKWKQYRAPEQRLCEQLGALANRPVSSS
jgi:hypothetical protein